MISETCLYTFLESEVKHVKLVARMTYHGVRGYKNTLFGSKVVSVILNRGHRPTLRNDLGKTGHTIGASAQLAGDINIA